MDTGIGLPNSIPGIDGRVLVEWARRAEGAGFSTLATIGRIAYPNFEELTALAAAAAVTERIGLMTNVLLGPTRNPVLLAKQAAGLQRLSAGRLTLGLGVGSRPDDFEAVGLPMSGRGRRWNESLALIDRLFQGAPAAGGDRPVTPGGAVRVPLVIGGTSEAALRRVTRWGAGWTSGGAVPDRTAEFAARVRAAWQDAGREAEPRIVALAYFALGPNAAAGAAAYLSDYYGAFGPRIAAHALSSPELVHRGLTAYSQAGVGELILVPTVPDPGQIELLASTLAGAADAS